MHILALRDIKLAKWTQRSSVLLVPKAIKPGTLPILFKRRLTHKQAPENWTIILGPVLLSTEKKTWCTWYRKGASIWHCDVLQELDDGLHYPKREDVVELQNVEGMDDIRTAVKNPHSLKNVVKLRLPVILKGIRKVCQWSVKVYTSLCNRIARVL